MTTDSAQTPAPAVGRRERLAWWAVIVVLAAGYAALRLTMNEQYKVAPWAALVELRAPLPFGHRVLMPLATRPLLAAGASLPLALGVLEAVSAAMLAGAVAWVLRPRLGPRPSMAAGAALLMLLPWLFLLPHRWPIFYPWDTPGMALLVLGLGAIERDRLGTALVVTALAALNRESALVLPVAAVALAPAEAPVRRTLAGAAGLLAVALTARVAVTVALPDNPGPPLHFTVGDGGYRVLANLRWLASPLHALVTLPSLGAWPLLWPCLAGRVDARWRRLWLLAWLQTAGLLVVANIYEPRAFGEVLVLAYLPTAFGLARWLGLAPAIPEPAIPEPASPRWLRALDRHGAWLVALGFVLFVLALWRWSFLPVAQWPMPRR
ncbi:MAG: hypothetical protein KDK70_20805 [Myxococcales bacterium]|nr:hypothetical protein [Myxococcales bacterium]